MPDVGDFILLQNIVGDAHQHLPVDETISENMSVYSK
jgi:hypothetical protein